MRNIFEKRMNIILISTIVVLCIAIGIPLVVQGIGQQRTFGERAAMVAATEPTTAPETTEPASTEPTAATVVVKTEKAKVIKNKTTKSKAAEKETKPAQTEPTTAPETSEPIVFATAAPVENKASYDAQWNAGYLVAIDNPDESYYSSHIELTDENRALLERLCMGEFGSGGFTGAALIAQAVKDAMNTYGYTSVADVISELRYDGRTDREASQTVKDAVVYVFDMDKSAIQHRILYMYNPTLMPLGYSDFHETQSYICTFEDVRFFDN